MDRPAADVIAIGDGRGSARALLRREVTRIARGDAAFVQAIQGTATVTVVLPEDARDGRPASVFSTQASLSDGAVAAIRAAASRSAPQAPFHVSVDIDP